MKTVSLQVDAPDSTALSARVMFNPRVWERCDSRQLKVALRQFPLMSKKVIDIAPGNVQKNPVLGYFPNCGSSSGPDGMACARRRECAEAVAFA